MFVYSRSPSYLFSRRQTFIFFIFLVPLFPTVTQNLTALDIRRNISCWGGCGGEGSGVGRLHGAQLLFGVLTHFRWWSSKHEAPLSKSPPAPPRESVVVSQLLAFEALLAALETSLHASKRPCLYSSLSTCPWTIVACLWTIHFVPLNPQ